jgi:hypothetical protein
VKEFEKRLKELEKFWGINVINYWTNTN